MYFLLKWSLFGGHVNFQGCSPWVFGVSVEETDVKIDQFQGSVKLKVESANGPRFDIQFFFCKTLIPFELMLFEVPCYLKCHVDVFQRRKSCWWWWWWWRRRRWWWWWWWWAQRAQQFPEDFIAIWTSTQFWKKQHRFPILCSRDSMDLIIFANIFLGPDTSIHKWLLQLDYSKSFTREVIVSPSILKQVIQGLFFLCIWLESLVFLLNCH